MAKTISNSESTVTANPFGDLSDVQIASLLVIVKSGQIEACRRMVQTFQQACTDYGRLVAKCGKAKHVGSSLSRKAGALRELSELDTSPLDKAELSTLSNSIRVRKAKQTLTGGF